MFNPGATSGTFTPGYAVTNSVTGCSNSASVTIVVSVCTGIDEATQPDNELSVYPNPNSGIFTIKVNNSGENTIEISDISGRIIKSEKINLSKVQFDISDYANGIYVVKIKNGNGTSIVKLVKE